MKETREEETSGNTADSNHRDMGRMRLKTTKVKQEVTDVKLTTCETSPKVNKHTGDETEGTAREH